MPPHEISCHWHLKYKKEQIFKFKKGSLSNCVKIISHKSFAKVHKGLPAGKNGYNFRWYKRIMHFNFCYYLRG